AKDVEEELLIDFTQSQAVKVVCQAMLQELERDLVGFGRADFGLIECLHGSQTGRAPATDHAFLSTAAFLPSRAGCHVGLILYKTELLPQLDHAQTGEGGIPALVLALAIRA